MKKSTVPNAVLFSIVAAAVLAGCMTVRETERPALALTALPAGRDVRVQIAGFDAHVTRYEPAYGYMTVTEFGGPRYYGRGRYCPGGLRTTTVATTEFVPRTEPTAAFRDRATDSLERCGFLLQTADPQYRVEVRFDGPFSEDGDGWATAGWMLLTAFTADYSAQTWTAKLKIHDLKTGRLLFTRDYSQHYEIVVWGPIPIFSPGCCEKTSASRISSWCLETLTDRAMVDAVDYLKSTVSR